jgi:hypothetical protein
MTPTTGLASALALESAWCAGGTATGGINGEMNGCPGGPCGLGSPLSTSGLDWVGRKSQLAMLAKPGSEPVMVPVHDVGIAVDPDCTQLSLPAMTACPVTQVASTSV